MLCLQYDAHDDDDYYDDFLCSVQCIEYCSVVPDQFRLILFVCCASHKKGSQKSFFWFKICILNRDWQKKLNDTQLRCINMSMFTSLVHEYALRIKGVLQINIGSLFRHFMNTIPILVVWCTLYTFTLLRVKKYFSLKKLNGLGYPVRIWFSFANAMILCVHILYTEMAKICLAPHIWYDIYWTPNDCTACSHK